MTIQWFPGHMAKARRQVDEKLKLVDFVIELVDARAPVSSENPMLHEVLKDKPKMVILMKKDLADPKETEKWVEHFKKTGTAIAINVNDKADIQKVVQLAKQLGKVKMDKLSEKGIQPRASRAMIVGIPNVGKSTLINRLASRKAAKTGDMPGITKQQLWIKVRGEFDLLDTPGILWPKFEDEDIGYRLAAIGTIKDTILSLQDIVAFAIKYMQEHYPSLLEKRYNITPEMDDMWDVFIMIGKQYGALEGGGNVNFDRVSNIFLQDLRSGRLGHVTFERAE